MKKMKINDVIMAVSIFVVIVSGIFCFVYDYVIWDKSIVPDWLFDCFAIPGWIAFAVMLVTLIIDKKSKR